MIYSYSVTTVTKVSLLPKSDAPDILRLPRVLVTALQSIPFSYHTRFLVVFLGYGKDTDCLTVLSVFGM
jgi:hypothetical protein